MIDLALAKTDEEGHVIVSHFEPGDFVSIEVGEDGAAEKRRRLGFMQSLGDGFQYIMSSQWFETVDIEEENEQYADAARLDILGEEEELNPNVRDERTNAEKLATSKAAHRARRKVDLGVVVQRDVDGDGAVEAEPLARHLAGEHELHVRAGEEVGAIDVLAPEVGALLQHVLREELHRHELEVLDPVEGDHLGRGAGLIKVRAKVRVRARSLMRWKVITWVEG